MNKYLNQAAQIGMAYAAPLAGAAGMAATNLVGRLANRVAKIAAPPATKEGRVKVRKHKAPIAHRARVAATIKVGEMTQFARRAPQAAVVASEIAHQGSAFAKLAEDLTDYGCLPSGETLEDAKNGAVFVNGTRFSLSSWLLALVTLRASRLVYPVEESKSIVDRLLPKTKEVQVMTGLRGFSAADPAVKPGDMFAIASGVEAGGAARVIQASEVTTWPGDTQMIFTGVVPNLAPDYKAIAKLAASVIAFSRDEAKGLLKLLPFFSEAFGDVIKLGEGVDFGR